MKRHIIITIAVMLGLLLVTGNLEAKEKDHKHEEQRHGQRVEKFIEKLGLSDEQAVEVREVFEKHREKVSKWREKNGEKIKKLHEKLREARESDDEEAVKEAKEKLHKLMEGRKELHESKLEELEEVLDEEQFERAKKMFERARSRHRKGKGKDLFKKLDLTEQQKEKVKEIRAEAKKEVKESDNLEEMHMIIHRANYRIKKEVLTDEQREELGELHPKRKGKHSPRDKDE